MKKKLHATVNSIQEYLDAIEQIKAGQEGNGNKADLIFRGQGTDKPLLPKLARLGKDGLLNGSIEKVEELMMAEFRRNILPLSEFKPENDWDLLALAQHYGLPTRLLDWSYSALVALWFAVRFPAKDGHNTGSSHAVVWVLATKVKDFKDDKKETTPYKVKKSKVFRSTVISRRISSQIGLFTLHLIKKKGRVYKFETTKDFKNRLIKLKIPAEKFASIRKQLDMLGVNNATIFPDLVGLCDHLQWRFSKYEDERELKR